MTDDQSINSKHLFSVEIAGLDNQSRNSKELLNESFSQELTPTIFNILESMHNDLQDVKILLKKLVVQEKSPKNNNTGSELGSDGERDLRIEFGKMIRVIVKTKTELAQLSPKEGKNNQINSASSELDAVVQETEHATNTILKATESLTQCILLLNNISCRDCQCELKKYSQDISQNVTKIIESCNFQDITGQRVRKVVRTMRFIEERVRSMVDIWGGAQAFANIPVPALSDDLQQDNDLLQGPQLANQGVTQDEIDKLFQ